MLAAVYGLSGETLTDDEAGFFRDADPAGYILFGRNVVDADQLRALTDSLRSLHGRDQLPILIDQEGGRVSRLQPPEWPSFPSGEAFARLYERAPISGIEAARTNALAIALLLRELGITVDCLPVLDLARPETHDVIGDRALGSDPMQVAALGRALLDGLREAGVVGVVKHMPGHGRATSDSHVELPVVTASAEELEADIAPFRSLRTAAMGMTAHVVYTAWDPERPASLSPFVIGEIIRGRIGFDGWLMSDDICMEALTGSSAERAGGVIAAGCDVALFCHGAMADKIEVAAAVGELSSASAERLARAMATGVAAEPRISYAEAAARRDALLAYA